MASALVRFGVAEQDCVGIFSQNRPEWSITDIAAICVRAVPVPIYATNTAKQAAYIINDARIRVLFVGDREQYEKAVPLLADGSGLEKIIVFNPRLPIEKANRSSILPICWHPGPAAETETEIQGAPFTGRQGRSPDPGLHLRAPPANPRGSC